MNVYILTDCDCDDGATLVAVADRSLADRLADLAGLEVVELPILTLTEPPTYVALFHTFYDSDRDRYGLCPVGHRTLTWSFHPAEYVRDLSILEAGTTVEATERGVFGRVHPFSPRSGRPWMIRTTAPTKREATRALTVAVAERRGDDWTWTRARGCWVGR